MNLNELKQRGRVSKKTQLKNSFKGFKKDRLFSFKNNEHWIQKEHKYWYHYAHKPYVTIYEYSGKYYLTIDGQNEAVEIKKITDYQELTIVSDFSGWKGDTIFEMDNGQIWKQDEYDYDYNYSYRPTAIIYSDGWNYRMIVEGNSIQVKRIK